MMILKTLRATWVGATLLVLAVTLYGFDGKPNSDIEVVLLWSMLLLAFPSGLAVALLFVGLSELLSMLGTTLQTSYLSLIVIWAAFAFCGYVQWFKFLPWFVAKLRARRPAEAQKTAKA